MTTPNTNPRVKEFGIFELDLQRVELRKQGVKVKLQEQPLKILQLLLEHPGEIISRKELRSHIWPEDTFVQFDQGLYSAMARLRDALGDTSESPRYIETVARRGYRFIAQVRLMGGTANSERPTESQQEEAERKTVTLRRLAASLVAGLIGGALLLAVVLIFDVAGAREWLRARTTPIRSIAVLPLENLSGDPQQEYFVDGMTDELITTLGRLGGLRVVSRTSVMRYKKTGKPIDRVGRELNVDAVVEGTVERAGNRVRIRVQLIQTATDRQLWAQSYDRELRDTLLLQSEAAQDIVRGIRSSLTPLQQQRLAAAQQVNPTAYEAYLKGLYFSNKRSAQNFARASNYFQQAIAADPSYGAAYSGLSNALVGQMFVGTPADEVRERATLAALKSIELDPSSPEAHDTLGGIREFYDWDWSGAEKEYRRAIELNENFTAGHQDLAMFLSWQGRFDEGLIEAQRSQDLDPLSPFIRTSYCLDLYFARHYEQAAERCQQALELDPGFFHAHGNLAAIYVALHKDDRAFYEYQKTAVLSGRTPAELAALKQCFQRNGMKGVWRKLLEWDMKADGPNSYEIASLYSLLGETDEAFVWLQRAYGERSPRMEELKQGSVFDNVRSDPRFGELLRHLNLQQ
jgi:TolB-like protein/DNA-binding winged helix-turn-helix (wHTH) protein/Tfp pilus assembly protein PilF